RLVEEDPPAPKTVGLHLVAAVDLDPRAQLSECVNVRIEPAPADHVAPRRRYRRTTDARQQRPREQERGADAAGELVVHLRGGEIGRVYMHLVRTRPFRICSELR